MSIPPIKHDRYGDHNFEIVHAMHGVKIRKIPCSAHFEVCLCQSTKAYIIPDEDPSQIIGITSDEYLNYARTNKFWDGRAFKALALVAVTKQKKPGLRGWFANRSLITNNISNPKNTVCFLLNNINPMYVPLISDGNRFFSITMPPGYESFESVKSADNELLVYLETGGEWFVGPDVTKWLSIRHIVSAKQSMRELSKGSV